MKSKMRFPKRRSIGHREWLEVAKMGISSIISGNDPGYNGKVQSQFKAELLQWLSNGAGACEVAGSGTNAIYVGLSALGLPKNSVVHVSPITDPGTIAAVILAGYRVNVLDTQSRYSGQTCVHSLERQLTSQSSAVLLIHHAGWAGASDLFEDICNRRGLVLFEDFSQSMGAEVNGQKVGTFGKISAASTMYRKTLATGGSGGVIYCKDEADLNKACLYKDRGKPIWRPDFYDNFLANRDGNNVQLAALNNNQDDINLAIGLSSLRRLDSVIKRRRCLVGYARMMLDEKVMMPSKIQHSSPFILPLTFANRETKEVVSRRLMDKGVPFNPDYRFNVSRWDWIRDHSVQKETPINVQRYLDHTVFIYINERYSKGLMRSIMDEVNTAL